MVVGPPRKIEFNHTNSMSSRSVRSKKPARKRNDDAPPQTILPRDLGWWAKVSLLIVAAVWVYWPALSGGFVLDDDLLITANPTIQSPDGLYQLWTGKAIDYWPVTNSVLWIEWRLWRMNSTGYHVTNLALHIIDALLVWLILRRLAIPGAFLAAPLFAVHPVNVESVAWIAQLKNVLAMLFFLLSILWYLDFEQQRAEFGEQRGPKKSGADGMRSAWPRLCWRCSAKARWRCCRC